MDVMEFKERRSIAERDADKLRRDLPRITLLNQPLHHDVDGALSIEDSGELGEDGQAPPDAIQPAVAER